MHLKCLKIFSPQPKSARINGNSHLSSVVTRITLCLLIYAGQAAQWGGHPLPTPIWPIDSKEEVKLLKTSNCLSDISEIMNVKFLAGEIFGTKFLQPSFHDPYLKTAFGAIRGNKCDSQNHMRRVEAGKSCVVFPREVKQLTTK